MEEEIIVDSASLAYREGTSDKVYQAKLVRRGDAWTVRTAYGRRGGTLTHGEKVTSVPEAKARRAYDALLAEKRGKGYKDEGTTNQQHSDVPPPPMLAESLTGDIRGELARLERGGNHLAEVKLDGMRMRVVFDPEGKVKLYARGSVEDSSARFPEVVAALGELGLQDAILDGELGYRAGPLRMDLNVLQQRPHTDADGIQQHALGFPMSFVAFDILRYKAQDTRGEPFSERRRLLCLAIPQPSDRVSIAPQRLDIVQLFDEVVLARGEGIVVKERDHPYVGTRGTAWLKAKPDPTEERLHIVALLRGKASQGGNFASLALARREEDGLVFWGTVASGLSDDARAMLGRAVPQCQVTSAAVEVPAHVRKDVLVWLDGSLMATVLHEAPVKDGPRHPRLVSIAQP